MTPTNLSEIAPLFGIVLLVIAYVIGTVYPFYVILDMIFVAREILYLHRDDLARRAAGVARKKTKTID